MIAIEPDTIIVTPSDREARVTAINPSGDDVFLDFEYLDEPIPRLARGRIHIDLVRAFQPGRPRPKPVRIGANMKR